MSCRVLALYITVCARVGLHNAPFSACRSLLLAPGASSPPRAAPVAVPFAFARADDGDDVVVVVASVDVAVVDDE